MVASGTKFTTKVLKKLLNSPNACVYLKKCKRHISLSPNALHDTKTSIREHLNQLITKFDSELGGVVLGCRNIVVLSRHGSIIYDSPEIHFDIDAEFYIFKPERGTVLTGIVKKKSRDNIGCLVHDIFNASIPIDVDNGASCVNLDNVYVGQPLTFTVEEVNFTDSLPYIRGKLVYSEEETQTIPSDRKRKRDDEHHPRKKMKAEAKSCGIDENKYFNNNKSNDLEHHDTVNMELELFPKQCTSILKKTSSIGTESSPGRRISFYGDIRKSSSRERLFIEENEENKTSKKAKKSKKDNQISIVETIPVLSTKKKITKAVGNDDRERTESFVEKSVPVKKKIKTIGSTAITDGASKMSENFDMESAPSQLKKKSKNIYIENINVSDQNDPEIELFGTNIALKEKVRKHKTKKEISSSVCLPEKMDAVDNLCLEDVTRQSKIKKCRSMIENEDQEYLEEGQEVDDSPIMLKAKKKRKKENKSEQLLNPSFEKMDEVRSKEKKKAKKEKTEKFGTDGYHENGKGTAEENELSPDLAAFPSISYQDTVDTSFVSSAQMEPSIENKNKKRKELMNADQGEENVSSLNYPHFESAVENYEKKKKKRIPVDIGKMSNISDVNSKKKPAANSTVIVNTTPLAKKNKNSGKSDDSFESISPIKKPDDHVERLDLEFVTSTQIDRCFSTESSIEKRKKKNMTIAGKEKEKLPITDLNSNAYLSNKTNLKNTVVSSECSGGNISPEKTSKKFLQKTAGTSLKGTTATQLPSHSFTIAASDSDSSSSISENVTLPNLSSLKNKLLSKMGISVETKSKTREVMTQKPAVSEPSSSGTDESLHGLSSNHHKTEHNGNNDDVKEALDIMSRHSDSSDSDDVVPTKDKQNMLPGNSLYVNDSKSDNDSSDCSIQEKLPLTVNKRKSKDELQNQFSSMKTFPTQSKFLSSKSTSPPKKEVKQTLLGDKNVQEDKSDTSDTHRTKKNSHVTELHPMSYREINDVTGRENVKSITPVALNEEGSDVNSSDSDLPSNYKEIIAKQKEKKEQRKKDEKEVCENTTDSLVKSLLLKKMKSEILTPENFSDKKTKTVTNRANTKNSALISSSTEQRNQKETSNNKEVNDFPQQMKKASKITPTRKEKKNFLLIADELLSKL